MLKRLSPFVVVFALLLAACGAGAQNGETTTTTVPEITTTTQPPTTTTTTVPPIATTTVPGALTWDVERFGDATVYWEPAVPENIRGTFRLVFGLAKQMAERAGFVFDPEIYVAATSQTVFRLQTEVFGITEEVAIQKTNRARGFAIYKQNRMVLNLPAMWRAAEEDMDAMPGEIAHVSLHEWYHLMQERLANGMQAAAVHATLPSWMIEASADFGAHLELRRYFCEQDNSAPCSDAQLLPYLRDLGAQQLAQGNTYSPMFVYWVEATGRADAVDEFFRLLGTHFERNPGALPRAVYDEYLRLGSDKTFTQELVNQLGEELGRQPTDPEILAALIRHIVTPYLGAGLPDAAYQEAFYAPWTQTLEALLGIPYEEILQRQEAYFAELASARLPGQP